MTAVLRRGGKRLSEAVQIREIDERHHLAEQLFMRRSAAGLSQDEVGRICGMSQAQVATIEAGHSNPTLRTLVRLSEGLGCGVGDLFVPAVESQRQEATFDYWSAADANFHVEYMVQLPPANLETQTILGYATGGTFGVAAPLGEGRELVVTDDATEDELAGSSEALVAA